MTEQSSDIIEYVADLRSPWQQIPYRDRERIADLLIDLNNRACASEAALEACHHAELVEALRATLAVAKSLTFPGDAESAPILASARALLAMIGGEA